MAIADKFILSQETANGLVHGIKVGGIFGRVGIYFLLYVPISMAIAVALNLPIPIGINNTIEISIKFFGFFGFISLPFVLVELAVRSWRKKNGFSINANIAEELKQRDYTQAVGRADRASSHTTQVHDLDYWFGMFQKNAITKEQYELKRAELLKN